VSPDCRLKAYIVLTFSTERSIFPAKRSRSRPNSVHVDISRGDNVQEILGTIGPFRPKWGWDDSRRAGFFCLVNHTTFWQLCNDQFSPNLATKRISVSCHGIRKDIFENFHFRGHLPPKSEIEIRLNNHLTQSRL